MKVDSCQEFRNGSWMTYTFDLPLETHNNAVNVRYFATVTKTVYLVGLILGTTKVTKSTKIGISLEYSIV